MVSQDLYFDELSFMKSGIMFWIIRPKSGPVFPPSLFLSLFLSTLYLINIVQSLLVLMVF